MLDTAELGVAIDQADIELLCLADNSLARLGTNGVGDDGGVLAVLHQQHLEVLHVVDGEVLEAAGVDVLGAAVATVTLVGHRLLSLVAATDGGILTTGLAPVGSDALELLAAVAGELLGALLHHRLRDDGLHHDF